MTENQRNWVHGLAYLGAFFAIIGVCLFGAFRLFFVEAPREPSVLDKFRPGQRLTVSALDRVPVELLVPATKELLSESDSAMVLYDDADPVASDKGFFFGLKPEVEKPKALAALDKPLPTGQRWFIAKQMQFKDFIRLEGLERRSYVLDDTNVVDAGLLNYRIDSTRVYVRDCIVRWVHRDSHYWD